MSGPFSLGQGQQVRRGGVMSASSKLRSLLWGIGEVKAPEEAEQPILAPVAREAVHEWMTEISAADALREVGLKGRSAALMHGPPGCGKTTLAHHLAARLGVPLVSVGAEGLLGSYLGESEKTVARLFDTLAEAEVPCVLFLDEIEAIGGSRDRNKGGAADNARTSILTVLLRRVEAFTGTLIAATNRPGDLDPALWRRFHLHLTVDLPGPDERFAIMARYALPYRFADDDLELLTELTEGASPALLRGLIEGVKRTLVIWPRLGRLVEAAPPVFRSIIASIRPPPELEPPTLWSDAGVLADLAKLSWPPQRPA